MNHSLRYLSPRERLLFLRSLRGFDRLSRADLSILAQHTRERHFARGEPLLELGGPVEATYLIVDGSVSWRENGKTPTELPPRTGVGFWAHLTGDRSYAEAVATQDTLTLELPAPALHDTYERSFPLLLTTMRSLARRVLQDRDGLPVDPATPMSVAVGVRPDRPHDFVDVLLRFQQIPLFGENLDGVAKLCHRYQEIRLPPEHIVWRRGDPSDSWMTIVYGTVACTASEERTARCGSDFAVGFMDALAQSPRAYTVRTETPLVGLRLDSETFLGVLEESFDLAMGLARGLARQVVGTSTGPA